MATGFRLEHRLDEAANLIPWKSMIVLLLEENELWNEIVNSSQAKPVQVPASIDATALTAFKKDIKKKRIIFDMR